jgi:hypothetical protein
MFTESVSSLVRFNKNIVLTFALLACASAAAQTLTVTRNSSVYVPNKKLTPVTIIDGSFDTVSRRQYIIVEGYINYIAAFPKAETDGDFHFEMQSDKNIRKVGNADPNGLVCEIDPVLQLAGLAAFQQIKRNDPNTFRKVRVYGWLRYGTETTHSGVRPYKIGGKPFTGHWEVHPVERIETIDGGSSFKIGPAATYVPPNVAVRYKLDDSPIYAQQLHELRTSPWQRKEYHRT